MESLWWEYCRQVSSQTFTDESLVCLSIRCLGLYVLLGMRAHRGELIVTWCLQVSVQDRTCSCIIAEMTDLQTHKHGHTHNHTKLLWVLLCPHIHRFGSVSSLWLSKGSLISIKRIWLQTSMVEPLLLGDLDRGGGSDIYYPSRNQNDVLSNVCFRLPVGGYGRGLFFVTAGFYD